VRPGPTGSFHSASQRVQRAPMPARFSDAIVAALRDGRTLRIRAGTRHRFIGIWAVVVGRRVFVRSWSLKPGGWWRSFLEDPRGAIRVGGRTVPVRAVRTRSERLRRAVDGAYLSKYGRGAARRYALDLNRALSRGTTIELVAR
jgi:hypothetical protein